MKKVLNVGVTLFFSCTLILFIGFCMDDGSITLDERFNWIGTFWTIVFLFSVVLILIGAVPQENEK
jgi:hypothetical protein